MRRSGSITRWNDDRGFGFVTADEDGEQTFLHISALPSRAVRPMVGDRISYDVRLDPKGRPQAVRVTHAGAQIALTGPDHAQDPATSSALGGKGFQLAAAIVIATLMMVAGLGWFLLHPAPQQAPMPETSHRSRAAFDAPARREEPSAFVESRQESPAPARFSCEGKTHCSQMTSCDEAIFYLRNCPGSVMDGDRDGLPCEDQWCGH